MRSKKRTRGESKVLAFPFCTSGTYFRCGDRSKGNFCEQDGWAYLDTATTIVFVCRSAPSSGAARLAVSAHPNLLKPVCLLTLLTKSWHLSEVRRFFGPVTG